MSTVARERQLRKIGKYDVLAKLAEGSMGSVYKGCDATTGELVAIKVAWPELACDAEMRQRFEREFRAASKLKHPNIVRGLDFGWEDSTAYLVMEYVDGEDLWKCIKRRGPLPEAEAVDLLVQVARGLHEAHKHGLVHRDIKPDNILRTADGRAKLADLGLIKDRETEIELTRPRKALGAPNFIAPEQFSDARRAEVRCDIYSLGATLYMALTGQMPFAARTLSATLKKKLENDLRPPRELVPALSERVDWAVRRAVQADSQYRYASCPEFIAALLEDNSEPSRVPSGKPSGKKGSPAEGASWPGEKERRASVRYWCKMQTSCNVQTSVHDEQLELQGTWEATVQDVSVGGLGVVLARRFEPGTVLTVELRGTDSGVTRCLEMRVQRVRRAGNGRWFVGGWFPKPLSKEELRQLL